MEQTYGRVTGKCQQYSARDRRVDEVKGAVSLFVVALLFPENKWNY